MKKKIISGLAAFVMAAGMAATSASAQKLGDVSGDNKTDIEDAVSVINHVNGQKSVGYMGSASADVNSDGKIDIEDAVLIINNINGLSAIEDKDVSPAPVEMTVDKLLSRSRRELTALSFEDYEFVLMQGQSEKYGFKCAAFPNYVFSVDQRYEDGKPNGPLDVPIRREDVDKHMFLFGNSAEQIELYKDAYVGEGLTVGMTYNEIKELAGGKLGIHVNNSSMRLSSTIEIDGRSWEIHYDLTDDQYKEIRSRIDAAYPDPETYSFWESTVDISDINPVSDIAVYYRR